MDRHDTHAQMMPSDGVCDSMGCEDLELGAGADAGAGRVVE